jgi:hypothetical protein
MPKKYRMSRGCLLVQEHHLSCSKDESLFEKQQVYRLTNARLLDKRLFRRAQVGRKQVGV